MVGMVQTPLTRESRQAACARAMAASRPSTFTPMKSPS